MRNTRHVVAHLSNFTGEHLPAYPLSGRVVIAALDAERCDGRQGVDIVGLGVVTLPMVMTSANVGAVAGAGNGNGTMLLMATPEVMHDASLKIGLSSYHGLSLLAASMQHRGD